MPAPILLLQHGRDPAGAAAVEAVNEEERSPAELGHDGECGGVGAMAKQAVGRALGLRSAGIQRMEVVATEGEARLPEERGRCFDGAARCGASSSSSSAQHQGPGS